MANASAVLDTTSVEAFDMSSFVHSSPRASADALDSATLAVCHQMAEFIHRTGVLVVRDPRVSSADNDTFLSMMQRYYSQPVEVGVCAQIGEGRCATPAAACSATDGVLLPTARRE